MNLRGLYWHLYLVAYVVMGSLKLLWLRTITPAGKTRQQALHRLEKNWAQAMLRASGAHIVTHGTQHLEPGATYVFYANHQSSFDIFTLMAVIPVPVVFLSKPFYFKLPLFGWAMREMGHFSITRKHKRRALSDLQCVRHAVLSGKRSLIVFPEGTRSRDGSLNPFKLSTLRVIAANEDTTSAARQSARAVQLVPTALINTRTIHRKGSLRITPARVTVVFGKPLSVVPHKLTNTAKVQLMEAIETAVQSNYAEYSAAMEPPSTALS